MPVLLVPLALVGVAMLSALLLYEYERIFGSPLKGLARSVPFIGGWIASGIQYAVNYAADVLSKWLDKVNDALVGFIDGMREIFGNFPAATDAALHDMVDGIDHLTHVTMHNVIKSFLAPVRTVAEDASRDATTALHELTALNKVVSNVFAEVEGDIAKAKHDVLSAVENVDLPGLHNVITHEWAHAVHAVAGDVDALHDWAGGWIDQLLKDFEQIPLAELLPLIAAVPALTALVQTIARESGLEGEACRTKVKGICGTNPGGWSQLLAGIVPLVAFPGLAEIVKVAEGLLHTALPAVETIAKRG